MLTQELLSERLGVRRTSVTAVASKVQARARSAVPEASLKFSTFKH